MIRDLKLRASNNANDAPPCVGCILWLAHLIGLHSLAGTGVASISLNAATANTNLGNGNALTHTASFTRNDGTTGTTANLNFAMDVFHRQFTDHIDTSAVANLPDMQACPERSRRGSGAVRELREAINDELWRMAA